jgi:DNA-binding LacI/PurR family transcriptional regulator
MSNPTIPTIHDVAKVAGVSLASVSQAFHNPSRVSPDIRDRILHAAEQLGYIPKFVRKRSEFGNIGLVIDKKRGPFGEFYSHIIMGVLDQAKKLKWNISLETYSVEGEKLPPMITEKKVDGIILLSKHEDLFIRKLIERKIPYCVADYSSLSLKHNCVTPDWYRGAFLATEYLIEHGHRKIAMIHTPLEKGKVSLDRISGYNDCLEKYRIPFIEGYMQNGDFSYQTAYQVCLKLLAHPVKPTAIFCATDVMALGAYKAIKESGLSIPEDISIIGFDNIELPYFMDPLEPALTTIDANKEKIGREALQIVHRIITSGSNAVQSTVLPVKIIERKSVLTVKKRD